MKIEYVHRRFGASSRRLIDWSNVIVDEYMGAGYKLTLRQLYYQFVSRGLIANQQREYKRLGSVISDARLAGEIDWDAIQDRGRNLNRLSNWETPSAIIEDCAVQYREDLWADQPVRVEVWIEKEALLGVFAEVCNRWRVPYFACKGYTSQSAMWEAGSGRLTTDYLRAGQQPIILHFGDHDPSGIDMTRDIQERLTLFACAPIHVERMALNRNQIDKYKPPPNPAKLTDPRAGQYVLEHGDDSWELDALEPSVLNALVEERVRAALNMRRWNAAERREKRGRAKLAQIAKEHAQ